jgi:hypothetical protein
MSSRTLRCCSSSGDSSLKEGDDSNRGRLRTGEHRRGEFAMSNGNDQLAESIIVACGTTLKMGHRKPDSEPQSNSVADVMRPQEVCKFAGIELRVLSIVLLVTKDGQRRRQKTSSFALLRDLADHMSHFTSRLTYQR